MNINHITPVTQKAGPGPDNLLALPEYIIRTFFPGLLTTFPFLIRSPRITRSLSLLVALWWFGPTAFYRLKSISDQVSSYFISSVSITSDEDLFDFLVRWLEKRRTLRSEQSLVASLNNPKPKGHRWHHHSDESDLFADPRNVEIQYEASHGLQIIIYKRRIFAIRRTFGDGNIYNGTKSTRTEILKISCLGRSTGPVKELLEEVYRLHREKEKGLTIIRRPFGQNYGRNGWARISQKPRRALNTVILDPRQKEEIIKDIEDYIDPQSQTWYGSRGIPYRRGYLFHGPPGTGKTSLAMALAGHFGLDIYVVSLLDQAIGDSELIALFNALPPRCLLLLEDIDTVGLSRRPELERVPAWYKQAQAAKGGLEEEDDDKDDKTRVSRVSLSGLLNAVDGVAAPEGHILIMTTNEPDKLDEALVRSGRVNRRVEFESATRGQARDIFVRMFKEDMDEDEAEGVSARVKKKMTGQEKAEEIPRTEFELVGLAERYAEKIPEHEFSPADLQDYLLMRKNEPAKAVEEVEEWKEKSSKERERKAEEKERRRKERAEKAQVKMKLMKEMMAMSDGVEQGAEVLVLDGAKKAGQSGGVGSAETTDGSSKGESRDLAKTSSSTEGSEQTEAKDGIPGVDKATTS